MAGERLLGEIAVIRQGRYLAPGEMAESQSNATPIPVWGARGVIGFTNTPGYSQAVPLVTCRGNGCGLVQWTAGRAYISNNAMAVVPTTSKSADTRYLYYSLLTTDFSDVTTGSAQPQITIGHLNRKAVFWADDADERAAIAHILGTLDDKIELNRQMSETLEAMARALFKSWFVDFDPVRAKMEGRWKAGQSLPGMPAHLYDLFPDSLVDSELGEIPEGWEVGKVDDLCLAIENGGTPKRMESRYWMGTIPWFKTGELTDGALLDSEEKITDDGLAESSCKLWPAGTILVALYASPTVGRLGILEVAGASNQACSALIAKGEYGNLFLFYTLLTTRDRLQQIAVGAAQQNISQAIVRAHKIPVPPNQLAQDFQGAVGHLYQRDVSADRESHTLASLRDALLPKLITGELRVKDIKDLSVGGL